MFPIICLSDQLDAVNQYIAACDLKKQEILDWFRRFGELVLPDEDHGLRGSFGGIAVESTQASGMYIYRTWFGFLNIWYFRDAQTIAVHHPLSGFDYNRNKKWIVV